ncbi:MAG TPA: DUF349 domain-containing protein [Flavipsychrobacter sp.]|nr:DUF349 domain-containing protein [Flavipsychrobacter sp.]
MTTEVSNAEALKQLWSNADLPGKDFFELKDNGDLVLKKTSSHPERIIASLTPENFSALTKALADKFPEVEGRLNELQTEWTTTEDKLKLMGKVSRFKEYLLHTNAIGNFDALHTQIAAWEKEVAALIEDNYTKKLAVAEQAEQISSEGRNWKETTQTLKDLAEQWKHIGYVERHRNDELWNRFEAAKQKFFDRKRQHHDDSEKEMLQNLDLKMEVVEKAESLTASEEWKNTTEGFRQLMDQWKSIGHTWNEKNEELWNRFMLAKNSFFERKNAHFEVIRAEQEINYNKKVALLEKAEALKDSKDWTKTTNAYVALMEEWKSIGRVPTDKADELWNKLHAAKDHFFANKRQHTETLRVTLEDNYAQKLSLAKRAEELKNSTQWRETTEEMNELFAEWKKIGPVPREHGDTLWEQFIAARKHFFNRKDADRDKRKQHFERKMHEKEERSKNFLVELENELKEEVEKLADFRIALENVTPGNKEKELRAHLEKLIKGCEQKITHKEQMIADIKKQAMEMEAKKNNDADNNKPEQTTS